MTALADDILRLRKAGYSYRQIEANLGCSKGTIAYHLGAGQKEKTLTRIRVQRKKITGFLQEYKQNSVCADCGENYPYWMLEFDHLRDKSFTIGMFFNKTMDLDRVKEEIEKCEVVCANCHKNRTYLRLLKTGNATMDISSFYE